VIKLIQKQRIILKHINGMSNRSIASELHMSKDTVNKYVAEYEHKKQEILANNPEVDPKELIQSIVEKPKYNADNREPNKVTPGIIEAIEECKLSNQPGYFGSFSWL